MVFTLGGPGFMNDVWRFEISPGRWTWMAGSQAITPYGSYYSAPKSPAGRNYMASWLLSNGDLIVFGGYAITGPTSYGNKLIASLVFESTLAQSLVKNQTDFTSLT
jgi:hypothetical protein